MHLFLFNYFQFSAGRLQRSSEHKVTIRYVISSIEWHFARRLVAPITRPRDPASLALLRGERCDLALGTSTRYPRISPIISGPIIVLRGRRATLRHREWVTPRTEVALQSKG
jgi:hypothetical protein